MARTFDQIKTEIIDAVATQPSLSTTLTSTSQTSIWRQLVDAFTSTLLTNDQLADVQLAKLNTIADEAVPGTPAWLQRKVLEFQYGDQLVINPDFTISYPIQDPSKCIVTRCSVKQVDVDRQVLVKVAKGTGGSLLPLSTAELNALKAYLERIGFAGINLVSISLPGDRLICQAELYVDGEFVVADVKNNVISAINSYLANLAFDGTLYLTRIEDIIQSVAGIKDVKINAVKCRSYLDSITSAQTISRFYETQSGYLVAETAPGHSLADTLTTQIF
jgi:enhancing lycopene biosynthesis protein 2